MVPSKGNDDDEAVTVDIDAMIAKQQAEDAEN